MGNLNTGSISLNIFNSISPMPVGISGLLTTIVDQNRFFIEQYIGVTIGSDIAESYQMPITDLATANVIKLMAVQDMGVSEVRIGDLTTSNENLNNMAKQFEEKGMIELRSLMKGVKFYKARS